MLKRRLSKNVFVLLYVFVFIILTSYNALAEVDEINFDYSSSASKCEKLFSASGIEFSKFTTYELEAFHPAYSSAAQGIFFNYSAPGFEIHIEHGPRNGNHTRNIEIKNLSINYDPSKIHTKSFFKSLFGSKPIQISSIDQIQYYSTFQLLSGKEDGEYLEITIDGNEDYKFLLMISRSTGKLLGYRLYKDYGVFRHFRNVFLEYKASRSANQFGRGTWSIIE